ncbi:acyl carrier protein [Alkalilimnicola sp. S0819]|uniref:acyl carrier protein n=1 Tax=Alkalilimnicola sp. S0819 TaxID=2613922 RepID=UPI00186B6179|nr:acyl carrier protein [Alkalilimnicola sp. S0819]
MQAQAIEQTIRAFIEEQFLIDYDEDFPEDSNLFKEGVMDSFGYVQLCRFLEQEYDFRFSEAEMTANVLVSLTQIRDFIVAKLKARAGA